MFEAHASRFTNIAGNLSEAERKRVEMDLLALFPVASHYVPAKFEVVKWSDFGQCVGHEIPPVTDVAIHGMRVVNMNMSGFEFPRHGFLNFHLYGKRVCVSGFGKTEREKLKDSIKIMGGVSESLMTPQTSVLIAKDARTRRALWARDHQIPIVSKEWITELSLSQENIPFEDFELRRLDGVRFSSSLGRRDQVLEKVVLGAGGMCEKKLFFNHQFLLISDSMRMTRKMRLAAMLGMSMTTPEYLEKYIRGSSEDIAMIMGPTMPGKVFSGYKVKVDDNCLNGSDIRQAIVLNHGVLVEIGFDFRIMSFGCSKATTDRSPVWVERCIVEQKILDAETSPLYVPYGHQAVQKPDSRNLVVSISGFRGEQKLDILSAFKWYGIVYSPRLTHSCKLLLSNTLESRKVQTALMWGIPVYSVDWIVHFVRGEEDELSRCTLAGPESQSKSNSEKSRLTFLVDDDDDDDVFLAEYTEEIERQLKEPIKIGSAHATPLPSPVHAKKEASPLRPSATNTQKTASPLRPTPANTQKTASPLRPSPKKLTFLSDDDDDFSDIEELEFPKVPSQPKDSLSPAALVTNENTVDDILSVTRNILAYKRQTINTDIQHQPKIDAVEMWDTCTQIPRQSDESDSENTVGYMNDDEKTPTAEPKSDPLMAQWADPS